MGSAAPLASPNALDLKALVYIHSKGVVHKDLKGQNLLLLQLGRFFCCFDGVLSANLKVLDWMLGDLLTGPIMGGLWGLVLGLLGDIK